jgi:Seven in absentia protein family
LALEKVAESLELPCKYYTLGCPEIFPYYSKLKHESQCNFRPYNCPYAGSECSIIGDIPFLVTHLRDDHKVDMHSGCTFNHRYVKSNPREVENATWMLTVSSTIWIYRLDGCLFHGCTSKASKLLLLSLLKLKVDHGQTVLYPVFSNALKLSTISLFFHYFSIERRE